MSKKKIDVIKYEKNPDSKQEDYFWEIDDVIEPSVSFSSLIKAYESNFILWGIVDKISTWADSWFNPTWNDELDNFLSELNIKFIFENLFVCGNAFFEIIKNGKWEIASFEEILTDTIRTKHKGWYAQSSKAETVHFWEDEVLHFKLWSLSSKYYWESKLSKCVTQIVLLTFIDEYYEKFFGNWTIKPNLLIDKEDVLNDEQKEALKNLIKDDLVWIKNSFATAIIPCDLQKLELWSDIDTKAFLEFRRELKEDISICLNIPYDLLSSQNSNRSTSEVAIEMLNKDIIKPLQKNIVRQLKKTLRDTFWNSVDNIEFVPVDVSNQLEESKIDVAYKKAWIKTANEIREKLWLEIVDWWDELDKNNSKEEDEIEEEIKKIYDNLGKKDV